MKETRWEYIEPVEIEGKCQPRNKNSQQINANDKHMGKLKRRDVEMSVCSPNIDAKTFFQFFKVEMESVE